MREVGPDVIAGQNKKQAKDDAQQASHQAAGKNAANAVADGRGDGSDDDHGTGLAVFALVLLDRFVKFLVELGGSDHVLHNAACVH